MNSKIDYTADPYFWQRFLRAAGHYMAAIDGDWGPLSAQAAHRFESDTRVIAGSTFTFDDRSEGNIATLLPHTQTLARKFLSLATKRLSPDYIVEITSGTRTWAEQQALYNQGRSTPGHVVTHAPPGYSFHNYGCAFDVTIFRGNLHNPLDDDPTYSILGDVGKSIGLVWGGDWKGDAEDQPHYQDISNADISVVRENFMNGNPLHFIV